LKKVWFLPLLLIPIALVVYSYWQDRGITIVPKVGPVVQAIYGMGVVRPHKKYDIKVGILTTVEKLYVREGQQVRAGDPLIKFIGSSLLRAPFSGTVINAPLRDSEPVLPHTKALSMADLNELYLEVSVEQEGALKVRRGQKSKVTFEGYQGPALDGEVKAIFPRDDEFLVHIETSQMPESVLPGMSADVAIEIGRKENAVMIPINSVVDGKVTVIRDGERLSTAVTTGLTEGPLVEITNDAVLPSDLVEIRRER
jgi:membrane fusion protein, macrolide-specific efflux system